MTREEAIRELKADYCGNRIICELYPDQCNREDCEIWLAIKALETQPDGNAVSRQAAIDEITEYGSGDTIYMSVVELKRRIEHLPSVQPEPCKDAVRREDVQSIAEKSDWFESSDSFNDFMWALYELPSAQPEITPDGTLTVSIDADVASVGRILLSQTGTQRGGLYYKDEQPEETCDTCQHGSFGDSRCEECRVGRMSYPSYYERKADGN